MLESQTHKVVQNFGKIAKSHACYKFTEFLSKSEYNVVFWRFQNFRTPGLKKKNIPLCENIETLGAPKSKNDT